MFGTFAFSLLILLLNKFPNSVLARTSSSLLLVEYSPSLKISFGLGKQSNKIYCH